MEEQKNNGMGEQAREHQVAVTQGDIRAIRKEVEHVSSVVEQVKQAIVGNPIGKDGGIIQRVQDCENKVEELEAKIEEIEKVNTKSALYLKIIWGLGGSILAVLASHFLGK